jgi:DNA-binding LacI/PurR family transcriptional regulator
MTSSHSPKTDRVTRQDVAKRAGVSTAVVSYVINGGPKNVSPVLRQRILEAIDELGYRPNKNAQKLMRESWGGAVVTGQYGLILGGGHAMLLRPYYAAIISGIYSEAERLGKEIRFMQVFDIYNDPVRFNQLVHPEEISGLILLIPSMMLHAENNDEFYRVRQRLMSRIGNIVLIDNLDPVMPSVWFDREKTAQNVMEHLFSLGHEHIAFVGEPDERLHGYRSAHKARQLPVDDSLVIAAAGNRTQEAYESMLRLYARQKHKPTAVFAASDEVAIGVYGACRELGLRVPHDVAVASIDDTPLASIMTPTLTSVRVPMVEMGAAAVQLVAEYEETGEIAEANREISTELIVRGSSNPAPQ